MQLASFCQSSSQDRNFYAVCQCGDNTPRQFTRTCTSKIVGMTLYVDRLRKRYNSETVRACFQVIRCHPGCITSRESQDWYPVVKASTLVKPLYIFLKKSCATHPSRRLCSIPSSTRVRRFFGSQFVVDWRHGGTATSICTQDLCCLSPSPSPSHQTRIRTRAYTCEINIWKEEHLGSKEIALFGIDPSGNISCCETNTDIRTWRCVPEKYRILD